MKKAVLVVLFLLAGIVEVCLFQGSVLYEKAKTEPADDPRKTAILEKEQKYIPLNDRIYYELGKAYFIRGVNRLEDASLRDESFLQSYQNYILSLSVNPLSAYAHFDFAQTLLYMDYFDLPHDLHYFDEFKKAAELTGHNTQIYYEVGCMLFARWNSLSGDEKKLTLELLKKITGGKDQEKLRALFHIWELHVRDYGVIRDILPVDLASVRLFAQFLGEKSLSRDERIRFLIQSESLEFELARDEFNVGQRDFLFYRIQSAFEHFQTSLESLKKIKLYQALSREALIDPQEFRNILKSVYLGLGKCKIEATHKLEDAVDYFRSYLTLEDRAAAVAELEDFLKERDLVEVKPGFRAKDFRRFFFELLLNFKQNRYRDIIEAGNVLEQSFMLIPEHFRREYAEVLELIGDSYQKLDYLYESNAFYQKSMDITPDDIGLLLKMRKNYERLNNSAQIQAVDGQIQKLRTPQEIVYADRVIPKGEFFSQPMVLDGKRVRLNFHFSEEAVEPYPLLSIFLNGQVIWEDYLQGQDISVELNPAIGINSLEVAAVNRPVTLLKLAIIPGDVQGIETGEQAGDEEKSSQKTSLTSMMDRFIIYMLN